MALALLCALAPIAADAQARDGAAPLETSENPYTGPGIADLIYGIYCAEEPVRTEPAPETASGVVNIVPGLPEMRFRQFTVPAARGIGFGVLVRPEDASENQDVTITITHPPFPDSGVEVERWHTEFEPGLYSLAGFTFDTANEEVPGEWTFTAESDGEVLFHIAFQVVPSLALQDVVLACYGGAIS